MAKMSGLKQYHEAPFAYRRFVPLFGTLAFLFFIYIVTLFVTELHEEGADGLLSKLCWRNATVRPPVLLVLIVGGWGQSLSPGNEQRNFWGTEAADFEGGRNTIGIKDPVIDAIIEKVISAPSRKDLIAAVKSLDRVLQWGHWVIPHWHAKYDRVAFWNKFGRPKITPTQGNQFTTWWVDDMLNGALKEKLASAKE